jgi:transposase
MLRMKILTDQQCAELRAQHKLERDRRICDRIKAVLLFDKGWTYEQIAEALLLSEGAVKNHITDYQVENKLIPRGGGSTERLTKNRSKMLEAHLQEHTYLYVKDIAAYIYSRWKISYSVSGLRNWLQRHRFSYRKPSLVPGKADPKQQQEWLAGYEKLKTGLSSTETICFIDGVHPTHNVQPAYGWIKKGEPKVIPANTGRKRINLTGAIDIFSYYVHIQEDKTLNAASTITFLQRLEEAYPTMSQVHVFCDNAPYYFNKEVREYLKTSKVKLHFLPPYSPNLNPIERLWKWMKEVVVYNTYYEEFEAFKEAIVGFFETLNTLPQDSELGKRFRTRIGDRFRIVTPSC